MNDNSAKLKLTLRQRKFCEIYTSESEFFGNGVNSYAEAYKYDKSKPNWYKSCLVNASKLLINSNILDYIDELLENLALNNPHVDKQLAFLIQQKADFGSKLGAIKEYNALRNRVKQKLELGENFVFVLGRKNSDNEK